MNPVETIIESLTTNPELENRLGHDLPFAPANGTVKESAKQTMFNDNRSDLNQ